jgi:outer membrane lipoprotein-sorting protein
MVRKSLAGLAISVLLGSPALSQTLDEIIAKNIEARGGMEKLKSVQTVRFTGRMTMGPGIEAPITLELKRPNQLRMELVFQGMTGVQAYDGTSGWSLMPFGGRTDPQPMSPEETKDAEEQADIDGPLVDYKEKGHTVELVGKDTVEGTEAYKIKVTLKNGDVRYFYLDSEYFLEIKGEGKRTIRGSEVETETSFGDYKEVEGLMMPHIIEAGAKGRPEKQKITIEKVELNVPVEDARFKMPAAAPQDQPRD